MSKPLTTSQIDALKRDGQHRVDKGLYIQIRGNARSWLFRYQKDGVAHLLGLGPVDLVPLADAKAKALEYRALLLKGGDPKSTKPTREKCPTFAECTAEYIEAHKAGWRSAKTLSGWVGIMRDYAEPAFGRKRVDAISVDDVASLLKGLWTEKSETARKLRIYLEHVLDFAKVQGYRSADNPARWGETLSHLLPSISAVKTVQHHRALDRGRVRPFTSGLSARDSIAAKALMFCLLTTARTGEVLYAPWSEIQGDVWEVPGARMKAGKLHRVPLSRQAMDVLKSLPRETDYIFPGASNKPMSQMALLEMIRGLEGKGATVHGLRAVFKTWASEETDFPREVIEVALAHSVGNAVEQAYQRGSFFEKRRKLMQVWADWCFDVPEPKDKTVFWSSEKGIRRNTSLLGRGA